MAACSVVVMPAQAATALRGNVESVAIAEVSPFPQVTNDSSDSWTALPGGTGPRDLAAFAFAAQQNGVNFATVHTTIAAHWDSADKGSVAIIDNGWTLSAPSGSLPDAAFASLDGPGRWTYDFIADQDGRFNYSFDLAGLGDLGGTPQIESGLGVWDLFLFDGIDFSAHQFRTLANGYGDLQTLSNSGGFDLKAGHNYAVELSESEFNGILVGS